MSIRNPGSFPIEARVAPARGRPERRHRVQHQTCSHGASGPGPVSGQHIHQMHMTSHDMVLSFRCSAFVHYSVCDLSFKVTKIYLALRMWSSWWSNLVRHMPSVGNAQRTLPAAIANGRWLAANYVYENISYFISPWTLNLPAMLDISWYSFLNSPISVLYLYRTLCSGHYGRLAFVASCTDELTLRLGL